jgi:hypothetical protein
MEDLKKRTNARDMAKSLKPVPYPELCWDIISVSSDGRFQVRQGALNHAGQPLSGPRSRRDP